jgi:hypothetical protein
MKINCPFCKSEILKGYTRSPENNGWLFVGEDEEAEVYDNIILVICSNDHRFYIPNTDSKGKEISYENIEGC